MTRPAFPRIEVVWRDSTSNSDTWVGLDDIDEPEAIVSIGFLVKDTPTYIALASSVSADGGEDSVGNTMIIPRPMIETVRKLKNITMRKAKEKPSE
jgi:hypothetical protein